MRHILEELLGAYALYVFGITWLIVRYASKDKLPMTVAVLLLPLIGATATAVVLFQLLTGQLPSVKPCPRGLLSAERAAAAYRTRLFGGTSETPKVAMRWAALYEAIVEQQAEKVKQVASRARELLYAAS